VLSVLRFKMGSAGALTTCAGESPTKSARPKQKSASTSGSCSSEERCSFSHFLNVLLTMASKYAAFRASSLAKQSHEQQKAKSATEFVKFSRALIEFQVRACFAVSFSCWRQYSLTCLKLSCPSFICRLLCFRVSFRC
jgi:hypothetical protein